MIRPIALALALAALATPRIAAAAPEPGAAGRPLAIGAAVPVPQAKLVNVDGRTITLAGAAGKKGTLVVFICNHCPWVKAWQSRIATIGNGALTRGIGVVAINANDPAAYPEDAFAEMVQRAKDVGYRFAYAADTTSQTARAFGATHTPEAFLFDAKGRLVYHGAVDDNAQEPTQVHDHWLADAVTAVADGKPVRAAETKAMGCSIKFRGAAAAN